MKLRPGNVHSAADWDEMLLPEIERQQKQGKDVVVRADAAFAKPELYEALEKRGVKYAIRIPSNDILEQEVASRQLEDGAAGCGEGGGPLWGAVSSRRLHRDDSGDRQPGGRAVLQ